MLMARPRLEERQCARPLDTSRVDPSVVEESTKGFEAYQLDVATRRSRGSSIDLSVWYLRRST